MPEINILDNLLGAFLDTVFGKTTAALDKRRAFLDDLRVFLNDQEKHTQLDVFLFSRRPKYGAEESADDFLKLEEIYVPLRMDQLRGTLPDFQEFRENPEKHEGLHGQKIENLNIAGLLDLMRTEKNFRKIMILGTAGSGKSTFMKYLTRLLVVKKADRQVKVLEQTDKGEAIESTRPIELKAIPIFIRLRDLEKQLRKHNDPKWENSYSLTDFVAAQCGQPLRSEHFFTRLFRGMPCLFLLDGIDEVPENKLAAGIPIARRRVMDWLLRQIKHLEHENPEARVILTSRPTDTGNLVRHFQIFSANKFNKAEIRRFTEYWYMGCEKFFTANAAYEIKAHKQDKWKKRSEILPERKAQFLEQVFKPPLDEIVENPLLLSLALYMHAMEERFSVENKEKLYERFSEAFLYEWDEVRDMNFYPELFGAGNYERLYELTYRLAFHFSKNGTTKMTARDMLPAITDAIGRYHLIPPEQLEYAALDLLRAFYERNGLLYGREASDKFLDTEFEFQHKSFQDYLAAQCIRADLLVESEEFSFDDKFGKEFWDRTLEFYVNLPTPDLFFKKTIEALKPGGNHGESLLYFTQTFLNARQKKPELAVQLALKASDFFLKSRAPYDIILAIQCLYRLPDIPTASFIELVSTRYSDDLEAFRSGKAVWFLTMKGHYPEIRQILSNKISLFTEKYQAADFMELCQWMILPAIMKDQELLVQTLSSHLNASTKGKQAHILNLLDMRDTLDWQKLDLLDWLGWLDWLDWLSWRDWRDRRDMMGWRYRLDWRGGVKDLRDCLNLQYWLDPLNMRDFRYLRGWRDLRDNFYSIKPISEIENWIINSIDRLKVLSESERKRYFKEYKSLQP